MLKRSGLYIAAAAGMLLIAVIALGWMLPRKFQRGLSLAFGPDLHEMEERQPRPMAQYKNVGRGWYKHASAYVHADTRPSNNARDAVASLRAEAKGTRIRPTAKRELLRLATDGEWRSVPTTGCIAVNGDTFRAGDTGPFFRIAFIGKSRAPASRFAQTD